MNTEFPFCENEQMEKRFGKCVLNSRLVTFVPKNGEKCQAFKPMNTSCFEEISNQKTRFFLF
jgi:hypothetical protein